MSRPTSDTSIEVEQYEPPAIRTLRAVTLQHGRYEPTRRAFSRLMGRGTPIAEARRKIEKSIRLGQVPGPPAVELPDELWFTLTRHQRAVLLDMINVAATRVICGQSSWFLYSRSFCAERTGLTTRRAWDAISTLRTEGVVLKSEALSSRAFVYFLSDELLDLMYEALSRPTVTAQEALSGTEELTMERFEGDDPR